MAFTQENAIFLRRCFDVGHLGTATSPNPSVGSVIVAPDGRIIGEGHTQPFGGAHAEVMAVGSVKKEDQALLPFSTIYVTLEPCTHTGKTKPCVDLIIREKIAKVVIAYLDPNTLVAGKSITKLRDNGVDVQIFNYNNVLIRQNTEEREPILLRESSFLNDRHLENGKIVTLMPFFINMTKKRPYVILKWAESADGYIGKFDKRTVISNNFSKRLVHKWRSEVDAIMVGTTTAELDNPELNTRFYYGKSPIRVVLDRNQRLSPDLKIFDETVKTIIFSEEKAKKAVYTEGSFLGENKVLRQTENQFNALSNLNNTLIPVEHRYVDFDEDVLSSILTDLMAQNIGILFVEGGAKLLNSFIKKGLWDEARVFKAAKTLGEGVKAPQLLGGKLHQTDQIDDDLLHSYIRDEALK
jgi:diaminohydroxyphosphoribosylaminopyrimidine deaminase / 5-amino-6-(5-phosphoribosylamino)uracil reductase